MVNGKILMYCNKLQKEFKKYEFFKIKNQCDLSYLIVIDDYYLISVFKDMSMDLFFNYGDEQDELLKSKNIEDIIHKIKLHKLLTPLNIF